MAALRNYFTNHSEYPWLIDRAKTSIFIQTDYAEDSREHNVNPMIIVESSGVQYSNDAIGNVAHVQQYKEAYVQTWFQFLTRGSINIHCIAEGDDASEELAFEVAMLLQSIKSLAGEILELQELTMPVQSKPQVIQRGNWQGEYDSVVSVNYAFAIKRRHVPIDKGALLSDIYFYLDPTDITLQPGTGETGGTNTGGQNGNYGGTGGINPEEGIDGVDDGFVTLQISVNEKEITVTE